MPDRRSGLKNLNVLRPIWRWTQAKFARQLPWRAFVSWQAYYAAYLRTDASHPLLQHTGPYVGTPHQQIELIEGMEAGRGPAIVCAPPGCGKSRFALEFAQRIERTHPRWQVVFVRHDEALVREELPQLTQLSHVVFIVDDAQECPDLLELLAIACTQSSATAPLHLVCLTRPTGRARVSRAIVGANPPGPIQEFDLGRPTPQLVRTLIDQLLPQSSPHHRETVGRFVRQSYFGAVLVCGMLRRDAKLPQTFQRQDLRDRIRREPLREAAEGVCPIEAALRALAVYAALAPVPRASADVRELAAQLSGLAPETVDILTRRMLETGRFQEDAHVMRPMPDLLGDLILEEACLDAQGRPAPFSAELLGPLLQVDPLATVRNCAGVGQLFGTPQEIDLVSNFVLERGREIPAGNQWDALKLLRMAQPLAACRPATVVELARIMAAREVLSRNPSAPGLLSTDNVEMATCELLMSAGEVYPAAVPIALGLGRELYAISQDDGHTREYVLGQLKAYCRLEKGRTLAHAQAVVDTLRSWVGEPDVETAALSASLNAQFMTLEVPGQQVWAVREVAMDSLTRAMAHEDAAVQCVAIEALARYVEPPERQWPDRWLPQLTQEAQRLSAALIELTKASSRLPVLAAAELEGWHWWAQRQDVLHRAGLAILQSIPDTDAYRLWKLLYASRLPVRTALPEPTPAQPEGRVQYVQALVAARQEDTTEQARQVFNSLDPRYADTAWRALWLAVLEQSPQEPSQNQIDVVAAEFARRHPEVAWSFVNRTDAEGPLFTVLPFLLAELGKLDRARRSQEARSVPSGTLLEEAWLRALSLASELGEPERAILARGLESADPDTVHRAADALLAAGSTERLLAFRRVFAVIARHPADSELWELVLERFVGWADVALPGRSGSPTDEMAQVADQLTALLRMQGSHLRWGFQHHTRQLANALAIAAVLAPRRLQEWMQREWGQPEPEGGRWSDESPLSVDRLSAIMRSIADSPAAGQWIETFLDWMRRSPRLAGVGAIGLAELCSLDDPRIGDLSRAIHTHPTDASQKALEEFVNQRKRRERPGSGVEATG
jgi:hypothetical protein